MISTRWLANPNQGHGHFPYNFGACIEFLFIIKDYDSCAHRVLTDYALTIEPTMVCGFSNFVSNHIVFLIVVHVDLREASM